MGAWILLVILVLLSPIAAGAQTLTLASGFDSRFWQIEGANSFELRGAFINLRKVFADSTGDRVILVTQYDFEDNFQGSHFYNAYAQLKGPLGKVNFRLGRYIPHFGLLAYYDTERLLLHTLDPVSLGIKTDVGANVFGFQGAWDYSLSISNGSGSRWNDVDQNKLLLGRVGLNWQDARIGVSYLNGVTTLSGEDAESAISIYKERFAVDLEHYVGAVVVRAELTYGRDGSQSVGGGFLGIDCALSPKLELAGKYGFWDGRETVQYPGFGLSYKVVEGVFVRVADTFQSRNGEAANNEFQVQLYAEFMQHL